MDRSQETNKSSRRTRFLGKDEEWMWDSSTHKLSLSNYGYSSSGGAMFGNFLESKTISFGRQLDEWLSSTCAHGPKRCKVYKSCIGEQHPVKISNDMWVDLWQVHFVRPSMLFLLTRPLLRIFSTRYLRFTGNMGVWISHSVSFFEARRFLPLGWHGKRRQASQRSPDDHCCLSWSSNKKAN